MVPEAVPAELAPPAPRDIAPALLDELWRLADAEACGLARAEFEQMVAGIAAEHNFPLDSASAAPFASLRLADLVLAQACAAGSERAWEHFLALYRQPLLRAAMAIAGSETPGRELADSLYAELYGLTARDGERRCPLASYSGRGSLMGWLRTTLAQRHVDQYRRSQREQPLDESSDPPAPPGAASATPDQPTLRLLAGAVEEALDRQGAEERFLLASYYLDARRLHEIAALLGVHEATVSRKLKRAAAAVRKQIVRCLEQKGLSRRQAEEALETDPRDLTPASTRAGGTQASELRWKELLQSSRTGTFKEQAER